MKVSREVLWITWCWKKFIRYILRKNMEKALLCLAKSGWACGEVHSVHSQEAHSIPACWAGACQEDYGMCLPSIHTHSGLRCSRDSALHPGLFFSSLSDLPWDSSWELSFMLPESGMVKAHHLVRGKMAWVRVFQSLVGEASLRSVRLPGVNSVLSYWILWIHFSAKGYSPLSTEDEKWKEGRNDKDGEPQPASAAHVTLQNSSRKLFPKAFGVLALSINW